MSTPGIARSFMARVLWTALLVLGMASGSARAAMPFDAGPYRGQLWTDPQTVALGAARVYVQLQDRSGHPLQGARVSVFARMPGMDMGERETVAPPDGAQPGLYVAPARFGMDGAFTTTITVNGSQGSGQADLILKTGQNTGGAPGTDAPSLPLARLFLWTLAFLFLLFTYQRLRKTHQHLDARRLLTRPVLGSAILLLVMLFAASYAVGNFRRPGAMTPIQAQAMEMETPAPPGTTPVTLGSVDRGPVDSTVQYTGTAVGYIEQDVNPRVAGWIQWMPFYAGDRVKKGQLLARLDTNELQSRVEQQRASRAMAEQTAAVSQLEYRQSLAAAAQGRSEVRSKEGALEETGRMKLKSLGMLRESRADLAAAMNERNEAEAMLRSAQTGQPDADAALSAALADQDYWSNEIARMKVLLDKGAVSGEEYQRESASAKGADAKVRQAQAKLQSVQSEIQAAQSRLARTNAMIESAQAKVEQAASEAAAYDGRIRMAQGDLDAARDNARAMTAAAGAGSRKIAQAQAAVQEAGAALTTARVVQGYTEIRSLMEGIVTQRVISPGVLVQPGQTILRVAQIDPIRLQANVAEADLGRIAVGSRVVVTDKGTGAKVTAAVSSVTPAVDPTARTGIVEAVVPNPGGRFLPGGFVAMAISTGRQANVLRVPTGAVQWATPPSDGILSTGQQASVWVADPASGAAGAYTVRNVPVKAGSANEAFTEIVSGLSEGQPVVTGGYQFLKAGDTVASAGVNAAAPHPTAEGHAHGGSGEAAPSATARPTAAPPAATPPAMAPPAVGDPSLHNSTAAGAAPARGKVAYKSRCGMTYSEAEARKYHYICPMDHKPLTKVVLAEGGA